MSDREFSEMRKRQEAEMFARILGEILHGYGFGTADSAEAVAAVKRLAEIAAK